VVRLVDVLRDGEAGAFPSVPADGVFYLVTLAVSDADSGAPRPVPLVAEVRDGLGRSYGCAWDVERLLDTGRVTAGIVRLVFDLPDDTLMPELVVRRPGLLNRLARPVRIPLPGPGAT
jgi:hypothetical protein